MPSCAELPSSQPSVQGGRPLTDSLCDLVTGHGMATLPELQDKVVSAFAKAHRKLATRSRGSIPQPLAHVAIKHFGTKPLTTERSGHCRWRCGATAVTPVISSH